VDVLILSSSSRTLTLLSAVELQVKERPSLCSTLPTPQKSSIATRLSSARAGYFTNAVLVQQ
jgi:hypothetical protein